jgi:hypothetical protein
MATGLLGQSALAAATYTQLYVVPAGYFSALSIAVLNRGTTQATIRIALTGIVAPTYPGDATFIEYDTILGGGGGVLERTGIMLSAGKYVVVYANTANVSVSVFGIETSLT